MIPKKFAEQIPEENTAIWSCSNEKCLGWMRDNFAFQKIPTCPLCQSEMIHGEKMLSIINNHNKKNTNSY